MHENSGTCIDCAKIFNRYTGFNLELREWFTSLQAAHPEAHISCAGRNQVDQMAAYFRHASNAKWLESAHNFSLALDLWENRDGKYTLDQTWFHLVILPRLTPDLEWFGYPTSKFYELPHIQLRAWREMVASGSAHPVE